MLPIGEKCDDGCSMPHSARTLLFQPLTALASALPFIATFVIVTIVVLRKLFPLLSGAASKPDDEHYLTTDAPPALRQAEAIHRSWPARRRIAAVSFSTTVALATVLAELILCEISNSLDPAARTVALRTTVPTLLFLLVVWIPFLELQSVIRGAGWDFSSRRDGKLPKIPWLLQLVGFAAWLSAFWWLGTLPSTSPHSGTPDTTQSITDAALSRVGVIGISLMALLSGFASVSSPWQSFGHHPRPVTESDVTRKACGLDATNDMLAIKRSRLRVLQRKISAAPQDGFVTKIIGAVRGNADATEIKALQLEISGLETMAVSLSTGLSMLQVRYTAQQRARTPLGRCLIIPDYIFSIYCLYRILATTLTSVRRYSTPTSTFSTSDPINRILALVAKHWDPTLDQAAWSRQISFLLSGIMLLLSFNSVLQTLHIFSRFTPGLVRQAQANLPLMVAQISATYVISSALLLRSNLPKEVAGGIGQALGRGVDGGFVEIWFEGWFLVGGMATAIGIWLGRSLGAGDRLDWDDYGADIEMGQKRC